MGSQVWKGREGTLQAEGAAGAKAKGQMGSRMFREEKGAQPVSRRGRLVGVKTGVAPGEV